MKLDKNFMQLCFLWAAILAVGATIENGYAQGGRPPGAIIRALAIDPSAPATLYAGTGGDVIGTGGGVFKSTNGGSRWAAVNSGLTNTDVYALAIGPSTPATLYAGTWGGVFKSTNGGTSWSAVNFGPPGDRFVDALAIDPSTPTTLYEIAGLPITVEQLAIDPTTPASGIFKRTNGGRGWIAVNSGLTGSASALAIDPSAPAMLYVGSFARGVFKSTNGGTSWSSVNSGLTITTTFTALAIDPSAPATVYAGNNNGFVYKSTNAGGSWTDVPLWSPRDRGFYETFVYALAIDPSNPATLYAGTGGQRSELSPGPVGGVFKSTSAGRGWTAVNSGLNSGVVADSNVYALAIDPSNPATLYAGTDGRGVFKSTNGGRSWTALNSGLPSQR